MSEAPIDPVLVDLARLSDWMDAQDLPKGEIRSPRLLEGGTQNILLQFDRGGESYVLRRPPQHKRSKSDETMRREARVLAALAESDVPHPRFIAGCPDPELIGAAFYLMAPVTGFNPTRGLPELHAASGAIRQRMGLAMVDGISALAAVDHESVGLADFGRPEGYLERQVARWRAQLEGYNDHPGYAGPEIPGLDEVAQWLDENRPGAFRAGIIHGDYHLANVMFSYDGPELAAIVDWELSTIGDPLLDLGWLVATWPDAQGGGPGRVGLQPWRDFPTEDELVARYAESTPRDLSKLTWYIVLACYKLGIILEGTYARACAGKASKDVGAVLHATTLGLFSQALERIR